MKDIGAAFDARFGSERGPDTVFSFPHNEGAVKYCLWALKGVGGEPPIVLSDAETAHVKDWLGRVESLLDEARNLAISGESRGGMAFDNLKKRSLQLADEFFSGPQRGVVFVRVAQAFDQTVSGQIPSAPAGGVLGMWKAYPHLEKPEYLLLLDIQKFSSWGPSSREDYLRCREQFEQRYPNDKSLIADAVENGQLFNRIKSKAYKLGASKAGRPVLEKLLNEAQMPEWMEKTIWASFDEGGVAARKAAEARRMCKRSKPALPKKCAADASPTVKLPAQENGNCPKLADRAEVGHPNSILGLKPAKKWTIVTDETGEAFGKEAFTGGAGKPGRYAFVLVPDTASLPPLAAGWHAVNRSLEDCLAVAENLYASRAGVIGIPVTDLHRTNRQLWFACIESLLDIVLRLLPLDGETAIELNVEQRGNNDGDNADLLSKTLDDAMYRLSLTSPDRARQIKLTGRFIGKHDCPLNGYADVVAYSWGCAKVTQDAFARFGWVGPCLISAQPEVATAFRRCLQLVHQQGVLDAADWNALVTSREARAVGSLIGALLRGYGEEARGDAGKWRIYLKYVLSHLDSKAIRMSLLAPQVAWLKEYEPDDEQLPPRLRLLWLTAQLAASNHRGGTQFGVKEHAQEFTELTRSLRDEDAPLTCFAALHLAVEMTDSFKFEEARALLLPWLDEPIAVPGLRYHGQVLSSIGQHEAFLGNNDKALEYFDKAFAAFSRLSEDRQREIDHTLAYSVIAAMDAGSPRLPLLMAAYLYGGAYTVEGMIDRTTQFASVGEDEPDSKYAHAILLRYLVTLPEDDPVRKAYLAHSADWKWSEDGHPWELIAFYRAILLGRTHADYTRWLRRGYDLAKTGGPTLQLIACVIAAGLLAEGEMKAEDYGAAIEQTAEMLPALGEVRLAALRRQTTAAIPPMDYAQKVLPFNFR